MGYLILGMTAGLLASVSAILMGVSYWHAMLIYVGIGFAVMILVPVLQHSRHRGFGKAAVGAMADGAESIRATEAAAAATNPSRSRGDKQSDSVKILAIDDDPSLLELIPMIAEEADFPDVTTASSGSEALAKIAQASVPFDCLLLDICMPDTHGIELCARIRKMPDYAETPIIMLTAMRDIKYLDNAFKAGATDYIKKPFDVGEIGEQLRKVQMRLKSSNRVGVQSLRAAEYGGETSGWRSTDVRAGDSLADTVGFVKYGALENYLRRLPTRDRDQVRLFALKIDCFEEIAEFGARSAINAVVSRTADAILELFEPNEPMVSYAGNGTFIITFSVGTVASPRTNETAIKDLLGDLWLDGKDGIPAQIEVSIGAPTRPYTAVATMRNVTFLEGAISSAEARQFNKSSGASPHDIRSVRS